MTKENRTQLYEILKNDYGITTMEQLDAAIARQPKLNIALFVARRKENDTDIE